MSRIAIFVFVTAGLLAGCRTHRYHQVETTTAVYEGQPVAVLPPESAPPPTNTMRQRERIVTTSPTPTERQPETEPQAPSTATPRATPRVSSSNTAASQFPVAKPVAGKPGFVYSPFESNGTMIDVTGYSSGTKVKDPGTNKIFIVP